MYQNKQLDILLSKPLEETGKEKKVYIKYNLSKTLRPNNIYDIIEDLYNIEKMLKRLIWSESNSTYIEIGEMHLDHYLRSVAKKLKLEPSTDELIENLCHESRREAYRFWTTQSHQDS